MLQSATWPRILGRRSDRYQCNGTSAPAWAHFDNRTLYKLSLVDALSFVVMRQHKIKRAFAFDTHFVQAGFRVVT